MSHGIICDRCKKPMYADSRSDKDAYCTMSIDYIDGHSTIHLCKLCHKAFRIEFLADINIEEYKEQFEVE